MATEWEGLTPPYRTIVADPPWRYRTHTAPSGRPGRRRLSPPNASAQYSTLTAAAIAAMPVSDIAERDAHLYLWATNPLLREAFDVMDAWGFRYITTLTWRKSGGGAGMGYYFRVETEHVLFGVRGDAPIPVDRRERNWFDAPRRGHSVKPPEFFDIVERVSPGPRVELFARQPRLGWDHWGYGYESERAS